MKTKYIFHQKLTFLTSKSSFRSKIRSLGFVWQEYKIRAKLNFSIIVYEVYFLFLNKPLQGSLKFLIRFFFFNTVLVLIVVCVVQFQETSCRRCCDGKPTLLLRPRTSRWPCCPWCGYSHSPVLLWPQDKRLTKHAIAHRLFLTKNLTTRALRERSRISVPPSKITLLYASRVFKLIVSVNYKQTALLWLISTVYIHIHIRGKVSINSNCAHEKRCWRIP